MARPRQWPDDSVRRTIRLPVTTNRRLAARAARYHVSINELIAKALEAWLEETEVQNEKSI
jgi:predicted HicB family RNase H-like nuclease